jgi:GT2 family glycosyltransferase
VVIVDDGSTDGTADAVREEFGSVLSLEIVAGDGSLWWAGAIEKGVERVMERALDSDYVVTLNNDVCVNDDFLTRAQKVVSQFPRAMIGSISVDARDRKTVMLTGWRMRCWPLAWTERVWWPCSLQELAGMAPVAEVDFLPGTATFTPVSVVRAFGTVRPLVLPHYHADSEYSYRLKRSGVPVLLARDLVVFHNVLSTGLLSNTGVRTRLRDVVRSFFSVRSGNYVRYKVAFARQCAPAWALVPFLVCDMSKAVIRSVGAWLVGERIEQLRAKVSVLGR